MSAENKNCLINEAACGRIEGNPVCPKCGMDERVVYPGRADLEEAIDHGKAIFEKNTGLGVGDLAVWKLVRRPRFQGDLIDLDNEMMIVQEDLDWGDSPTYLDVKEARSRYIKRIEHLAAAGSQQAKLIYGRMLVDGVGEIQSNPTKAHLLFREVLNEGNEAACSYIGALYEDGQGGLPQDDFKAREWYERGVVAADPRAIFFLADLWAQGKGGLAKDESKALGMALDSARKGCGSAYIGLALKCQSGDWGVGVNMENAKELFSLGLARGHAGGAMDWIFQAEDPKKMFGEFSRNSVMKVFAGHICASSSDADPLKMSENFLEGVTPALTQQDAANEWVLSGDLYTKDKEDEALAMAFFNMWAKLGCPTAMFALAIMLCFTKRVAEQMEAVDWLRKAAEAEHPAGMYFYGRFLLGFDLLTPKLPWVSNEKLSGHHLMTDGVQWLERAAKAEQSLAMFDLGVWLVLSGEQDRQRPAQLLQKAAEAGMVDAYRWLTMIHSSNFRDGWEYDAEAAERYCRQGSEAKVPYCMDVYAGQMYNRERYQEAFDLWAEAAEAGLPRAFFGLAAYHFNGIGPQSDPSKAFQWAERAAHAEIPEGMRLLGVIYWTGKGGVQVDLHAAKRWFENAIEKGDESSQEKLNWVLSEIQKNETPQTERKKSGFWSKLFG